MASLDFEKEKSEFRDFYSENVDKLNSAKDSFCSLVKSLLEDKELSFSKIEGRVKDKEECIKKFQRKYLSGLEKDEREYEIKEYITDLIGVRVVCLYEDDIEKIEKALGEHFDVKGRTDKTYEIEKTENLFGYKGLHLDLCLNDARKDFPEYKKIINYHFEIQIRTIIQDSWSVLDHKIKYKKSIPENLKRRINRLAALFELADSEFKEIRNNTTKLETEELGDDNKLREEYKKEIDRKNELGDSIDVVNLNSFSFLRIAQHFFPDNLDNFEAKKVDGFTQEIISLEPGISRSKFNFYMQDTIQHVKNYKSFFENKNGSTLNPYTMIRHCLYLSNKEIFKNILLKNIRDNFNRWLEDNPKI